MAREEELEEREEDLELRLERELLELEEERLPFLWAEVSILFNFGMTNESVSSSRLRLICLMSFSAAFGPT